MSKSVVGCLAVVVCLLCLSTPSLAIDCDTLPPRFPFQMIPLDTIQFGGGNDCWGWVSPGGSEYAIFGGQTGIGFVNASTGAILDFEPGPSCTWRDIKTYRNYAYEVSECGPGMRTWNLSFLPDSVHLVGTFINGSTRSHNLNIDTAKGFAYLVRQNYTGFRVIDLSNPESPTELSGVLTGDLHDIFARNDTVWAAEGNDHVFSIWNMANKSAPAQIAAVTIPGNGYVHNIWPTADGRYVATTEETAFKTVKIWNTSNLSSIGMVSEYVAPSNLAHNAHIEGNYLYISHYESGVAVVDISYPECPVQVALFDNYLGGEGPSFNGCWGVYPHANTGKIYASTIEGGLYIFSVNAVTAEFFGSPLLGEAPLSVDFTDNSPGAPLDWDWDFGDGTGSTQENPTHLFPPGIWNVALDITTSAGSGHKLKVEYVTALAETLKVADTTALPNTSVVWEIWHENNVPIKEIKLPIALTGVPAYAAFDSISAVGCRTSYFEQRQLVFDNRGNGQAAMLLKADNGGGSPPLAPGNGPIAKIHFRVKSNATAGQQVVMTMPTMGTSMHSLQAFTLTTQYVPELLGATATVVSACDCSCHADPVCDGFTNVQDVVSTVNEAFRGAASTMDPACPHVGRTDVDCSGFVDIVDVVLTVNVAFRGADSELNFCDPCGP